MCDFCRYEEDDDLLLLKKRKLPFRGHLDEYYDSDYLLNADVPCGVLGKFNVYAFITGREGKSKLCVSFNNEAMDNNYEILTDIKYCPMCGRKLE